MNPGPWIRSLSALAALLAAMPASAGPEEEATLLYEQARAALALRDRPGALRLSREAVAKNPRHVAANTLLADDADSRSAHEECATFYERAADGAAVDARLPAGPAARVAHLASAMACAAKLNDNLARLRALAEKKKAAEAGLQPAGAGGGCESGRYGWQRFQAGQRTHDRLIDRMIMTSASNDRRQFCAPMPLLQANRDDSRRALADARGMLTCRGEDLPRLESRLRDAAQELAAAAALLPNWERQCPGMGSADAGNRPPAVAAAPPGGVPAVANPQEEALVQQLRQQLASKQLAAAKATAAQATAQFPASLRLWRLSGMLGYELNDTTLALNAFQKALALDPSSRSLKLSVASLLCETKRVDEAMVHFDAILERQPNDADALSSYNTCRLVAGLPQVRQYQPRPR